MATRKTASHKTITPLFRVLDKSTGNVIYRVRNGENREYIVTLSANGNTGCTACDHDHACPSFKSGRACYHVKECEELESKRVVLKVGEQEVSGKTSDQAVAKALRLMLPKVRPVAEVVEEVMATESLNEEVSSQCSENVPSESPECSEDVPEICTRCRNAYAEQSDLCSSCNESEEVLDEETKAALWAAEELVKMPAKKEIEERMMAAPLNGQRGFSILKR